MWQKPCTQMRPLLQHFLITGWDLDPGIGCPFGGNEPPGFKSTLGPWAKSGTLGVSLRGAPKGKRGYSLWFPRKHHKERVASKKVIPKWAGSSKQESDPLSESVG